MSCLCLVYVLSMSCLCLVYVLSMSMYRDREHVVNIMSLSYYVLSMSFLYLVYVLSISCLCIVNVLSMSYLCLVYVLSMSCLCLVYVLSMSCLCLVCVLSFSCLCLVYVWSMSGLCLVYVFSMSCLYLVYVGGEADWLLIGEGRWWWGEGWWWGGEVFVRLGDIYLIITKVLHTYRQTDPPTKRVLEEHLLLKILVYWVFMRIQEKCLSNSRNNKAAIYLTWNVNILTCPLSFEQFLHQRFFQCSLKYKIISINFKRQKKFPFYLWNIIISPQTENR